MALIKCPECGKEYSDKASSCPNCGCPTENNNQEEINIDSTIENPSFDVDQGERRAAKSKKKIIWIISISAAAIALVVLGVFLFGGKGRANKTAKEAYEHINAAYEILSKVDEDICEAWRKGIYSTSELKSKGATALAESMNISENDLADGLVDSMREAILWYSVPSKDVDTITDTEMRKYIGKTFKYVDDSSSIFTYCVLGVIRGYELNGKLPMAKDHLEKAQNLLKTLGDDYPDYVHYASIKDFYTTTSLYYDFCTDPKGSYDQRKTAAEDYRSTEKEHKASLDYIFK